MSTDEGLLDQFVPAHTVLMIDRIGSEEYAEVDESDVPDHVPHHPPH